MGRALRNQEALLLLAALFLMAYAGLMVTFALEMPVGGLLSFFGVAVLYALAHIAVRRFAPLADPFLLPVVALLNALGLVMIHRLDISASGREDAPLQLIWTAVGVTLFISTLMFLRDHRRLSSYMWVSGIAGLTLLALPALLPSSISEVNGAKIWIRAFGFSIQPGEFAKIAVLIFFAGYLTRTRDVLRSVGRKIFGITLPRGRDLAPLIIAWLSSVGILVFERDLGTSLLFFGSFVLLLYLATERISWLVLGGVLFIGGASAAYYLFSHVQDRVDVWLNPWPRSQGAAYQLVQAIYGLGTGGILGTGLGQGRPTIVPFVKTDFIVAAFGEELGSTGLMALLLLFALMVQRIFRTAVAARDLFGQLLVGGVGIIFALQIFVVIGGVTRVIPLTGLTTPFLSYGGSSLVANWALIAIVLRVSHQSRSEISQPGGPPPEDLDQTQVVRL
jgi:cell division protein FtsW (lipid II flippase)